MTGGRAILRCCRGSPAGGPGAGPSTSSTLGRGPVPTSGAVAPLLGGVQRWTLIEHDPALIDRGRVELAGCGVAWVYRRLDLAADLERLADTPVDLITSSALLDLVAEPWLERLAAWRRRTGAALYMALTYDGRCAWEPRLPFDDAALDLVNRHQRTDKGFGPALGPKAAAMPASPVEQSRRNTGHRSKRLGSPARRPANPGRAPVRLRRVRRGGGAVTRTGDRATGPANAAA